MNSVIAQWEDEDCNRQVQFSVEYSIENGAVEIANVTPTKVSFICEETNTIIRSIGVHTLTGCKKLAEQIIAAGQIDRLKGEIIERNNELVSA